MGALYDFTPFIRDNEGLFWLGGFNGLYRIDIKSGDWTLHSHNPENSATLPKNDVRDLLLDSKGRLWVGTSSGLSQLIKHSDTDSISFINERFSSVYLKGRSELKNK